MDTMARGLLIADNILENSDYKSLRNKRYSSYDSGDGAKFEKGDLALDELAEIAAKKGEPKKISGKQEYFEALINQFIK